jgi:hypothetical protein
MSRINHPPEITPRLKALGFSRPFGEFVERETKICVVIVVVRMEIRDRFGVYITHGSPGGRFWRNSPPLVSADTMKEAMEVAETIYGITGSGELATVVYES